MNEITCHECGHSINEHGDGRSSTSNCNEYLNDGLVCICTETPQDIATYAVAEARRAALNEAYDAAFIADADRDVLNAISSIHREQELP